MTAPRACRSCGAPLPPDVRWCMRCYRPVAGLTPRERQLPPVERAEEPPPWVNRSPLREGSGPPPTYSRWRAGPTTFGPVGRIAITVVVLLIFPWDALFTFNPFRLWFMLGYTIFAAYVLRHTWRKERVLVERPVRTGSIRSAVNGRVGVLSRSVDARVLVVLTALAALSGLGYAWVTLDRVGRFAIVAVGVCGMGAIVWAWWTET
jgi:hypothetical protein